MHKHVVNKLKTKSLKIEQPEERKSTPYLR